jgi:hypothetical protein
LGRDKKESTTREGAGLQNRTPYGAALAAFERPPVDPDDEFEALTREKFEREAKAFRESSMAMQSSTASSIVQSSKASKASEEIKRAEAARAEPEPATDTSAGQETQETQEGPSSSSQCYFKPDPMGPFRDMKVPEKPAGPPPLSDAEKDLMSAVCGGDLQKAEALLTEHGPPLLSGHGGGGITTTAILYAAQSGNKAMCDLLVAMGGPQVLEKGRDIKSRGAAEYAEKGGHTELASHLKTFETNAGAGIKAQESKKVESAWRP